MSNYDRNSVPFGSSLSRAGSAAIDQGLRAYMLGVYNHMGVGLAVTGLVAYIANYLSVAAGPTGAAARVGNLYLTNFGATLYTGPLHWIVMLAPLAFVFFFSFRIDTMAPATARSMFYAFAAVMGLSLSVVLLVYTHTAVARAFFITAATFGSLSLYGYTTKKDLTAIGTFCVMALIGLVIASIVNIFVASAGFSFILSIATVLIFSGLTAWDTQMIKEMYFAGDSHEVTARKSINGALMLYLDFINIFQSMLALFGDRRD